MRISVVVPSYNHADFVEEAISSIASQGDRDTEIVVVDDGSTDDSLARIRPLLEAADVANVVLHEQANAGAHAAITRGLELASGDCLTILNSDDFYRPGRLGRIRERIGEREQYLLFTGVAFVDRDSEEVGPGHAYRQWYERMIDETADSPTLGFALLRNNLTVTSGNLAFGRALYEELGGFADLRFCHDWDFAMRATRMVEPDFIEDALICYRVHDANSSHSLRDVQEQEAREALNRFLGLCRDAEAPNPKAPCPENWRNFFDLFVSRHAFHFDTDPIAHYIDDPRH